MKFITLFYNSPNWSLTSVYQWFRVQFVLFFDIQQKRVHCSFRDVIKHLLLIYFDELTLRNEGLCLPNYPIPSLVLKNKQHFSLLRKEASDEHQHFMTKMSIKYMISTKWGYNYFNGKWHVLSNTVMLKEQTAPFADVSSKTYFTFVIPTVNSSPGEWLWEMRFTTPELSVAFGWRKYTTWPLVPNGISTKISSLHP